MIFRTFFCRSAYWLTFYVILFTGTSTLAQQITSTVHTATATATFAPAPTVGDLGVTDEIFALSDALIRELRRGGYVIYMRHGPTQPGTVDTPSVGDWWKDCNTTQRLGALALPQAQAIGLAWNRHRIFFHDVLSSEFCRAADTGVFLGVAAPSRVPALNASTYFQSLNRPAIEQDTGITNLLASPVAVGKNRLLIGHILPISNNVHPALSTIAEGYTAIFKPVDGKRFSYVTTLSPGQWQWLGKQIITDQAAPVIATSPSVPVVLPPAIDPAKEVKGLALVEALRKGGYTLYMRHALSNVGSDQDFSKVPRWWENCAIQRNIADMGKEQARKIGAAVRALGIPIADIKVSQFCRVRDTGHSMGLGTIEVTEELNHVVGQRIGTDVNMMRFKLLAEVPAKGRNMLLISHTHGSPRPEERVMGQLQEAEIAVYQPDGKGGTEPIARIPIGEWDNLLSLAGVTLTPPPSTKS